MIKCVHIRRSVQNHGRVLWSRVHTALLAPTRAHVRARSAPVRARRAGARRAPGRHELDEREGICERCVISQWIYRNARESVHKVRRARPRPLRVISPESLFIYILTPPQNGSRAVPSYGRARARHPTQFLEAYTLQHRRPAARAHATAHTTVALLLPDSSLPSLSLSLCTTRSSRAN